MSKVKCGKKNVMYIYATSMVEKKRNQVDFGAEHTQRKENEFLEGKKEIALAPRS